MRSALLLSLVVLIFTIPVQLRAHGSSPAEAVPILADADRFHNFLQSRNRFQQQPGINIDPLLMMLTHLPNRDAFVNALKRAKEEVAPVSDWGARAQTARKALRGGFLRQRGHLIDVRFCRALKLNDARCEELDCLTAGAKGAETKHCQAKTYELGEGPPDSEAVLEWLDSRKQTPEWHDYAKRLKENGEALRELPFVREAQDVRDAIDRIALRLVDAFPLNGVDSTAVSKLVEAAADGYAASATELHAVLGALSVVFEESPFGEIAQRIGDERLGPETMDRMRAQISNLTLALDDDPYTHEGVEELVRTIRNQLLLLQKALEPALADFRSKLAALRSEEIVKRTGPVPSATSCNDPRHQIVPLASGGAGDWRAVLLLSAKRGDEAADLYLESSALGGKASVRDGKQNISAQAAQCVTSLRSLGIRFQRVVPPTDPTQHWRVADRGGRPVLGIDRDTALGVLRDVLGEHFTVPDFVSITSTNVILDDGRIGNLRLDLGLRVPVLDLPMSRSLQLLSNGRFNPDDVRKALGTEAELAEEIQQTLRKRSGSMSLTLVPGIEVQDITLVTFQPFPRGLIFSGTLRIGGRPQANMRLELRRVGDRWVVAPMDDLADLVKDQVLAALNLDELAQDLANKLGLPKSQLSQAEKLKNRISLRNVTVDQTRGTLTGVVQLSLTPAAIIEQPISFGVASLKQDLTGVARDLVNKILRSTALVNVLRDVLGEVAADALAQMAELKSALSQPREFFGLTLQPEIPPDFDGKKPFAILVSSSAGSVRIAGFRVRGLSSMGLPIVDAQEVKVDDETANRIGVLVRGQLNSIIPASVLSFGRLLSENEVRECAPPRLIPVGVGMALDLSVHIPIAGCVPLPTVSFGFDGVEFDEGAFRHSIEVKVLERLKKTLPTTLPDTIRDFVTDLDPKLVDGGYQLHATLKSRYLGGRLVLRLPSFEVIEFSPSIDGQAQAVLAEALQRLLGGAVNGIVVKGTDAAKLSVYADVTFKILDQIEVTISDVQISLRGVTADGFALTLPSAITVPPTPFVITQPTIHLTFDGGGTFGLGGRVSIVGVDSVYHIRALLEGRLREQTVRLSGDSYVLNYLNILHDEGDIHFRQPRLSLSSETAGPLKTIAPIRQQTIVDGDSKSITWQQTARLLGVSFEGQTELRLGVSPPQLVMAAKANLRGLANTSGSVATDILLTNPSAKLKATLTGLPVVGSTEVSVEATHSYARSQVKVTGLSLGVTTPSLSLVNGDVLRSLLERLLRPKVDIRALAKILKERRIEISFVPAGKGSEFNPHPGTTPGTPPAKGEAEKPASAKGAKGAGAPPAPAGVQEAPWLPPGQSRAWAGYQMSANGAGLCWTIWWQSGDRTETYADETLRSQAVAQLHLETLDNWQSRTWLDRTSIGVPPRPSKRMRQCRGKAWTIDSNHVVYAIDWAGRRIITAFDSDAGTPIEIPSAFDTLAQVSASFKQTIASPHPRNSMKFVDYEALEILNYLAAAALAPSARGKMGQPRTFDSATWSIPFERAATGGVEASTAHLLVRSQTSRLLDHGSTLSAAITRLMSQNTEGSAKARAELARLLFENGDLSILASSHQALLFLEESTAEKCTTKKCTLLALELTTGRVVRATLSGKLPGVPWSGTLSSRSPAAMLFSKTMQELLVGNWDEVIVDEAGSDRMIVFGTKLDEPKNAQLAFLSSAEPECVRKVAEPSLREALLANSISSESLRETLERGSPFARQVIPALRGDRNAWSELGFVANPRAAFRNCG